MPNELLTREQVEKLKDATPVVVAHICDTLLATMDERDRLQAWEAMLHKEGDTLRGEVGALRTERDALRRAVNILAHEIACDWRYGDACNCIKSRIGGAK